MPTTVPPRLFDHWIEPAAVFSARDAGAENAFWLEDGLGEGWSYLGRGSSIIEHVPAPARRTDAAADPAAPPFQGGWVGWHGYEGQSRFLRIDEMIAVHHASRRIFLVAPENPAGADIDVGGIPAAVGDFAGRDEAVTGRWRHDDDRYLGMIDEALAAIRAGDAYQLCLTNMWHSASAVRDTEALWHRLRAISPSHHSGYLRIGDTTLLSTSPEQFLTISPDGRARTRPIKGTQRRGDTPEQDRRLADELRTSEKERAENLMIVDLMRNDLSQVAVTGTVDVTELFAIESYRQVHQLVSTIQARLRPDISVVQVIDALFPAGSMTGAPKRSAMSILSRLEQGPRGIFSGVFGIIGEDGRTDLAMVIRSIVVDPAGTWIGAGGGITVLSDPIAELAELKLKAAPLIASLAG
jgi:anthranilate/para-aminobenzoate synthase component I